MRLAIALCLACGYCAAQPGSVASSFEVASVRRLPVDSPRQALVREITPTSLTLRNATLGNCILFAFGYQHFEVIGANWRDRPTDVIYDIVGKTADPVPESQLKLMLQALLKERLGLAFHLEQRALPVYALVVSRNGPKFHQSETAGDPSMKSVGLYVTRFQRVTMAQFAKTMDPPYTSRHVVDETGLAGVFDFTLDLSQYVLDPETGKPIVNAIGRIDEESAFLEGLPEKLGLRLERKTAPMTVMVIDHIDKDPIAN